MDFVGGITLHMTLWNKQASKWDLIGAPLRPSPADIENHIEWIKEFSHRKNLSVLLCGVTPEIVHIPWPKQTKFIAVDNNPAMLKSVLPQQTSHIKPLGLRANWIDLPLPSSSVDLVIGDGCYTLLKFSDYAVMTREIRRVLKSDGMFSIRFFLQPEIRDSLDKIKLEISSKKISSFHAFKLQLAMALHQSQNGVRLGDIWDCWNIQFRELVDEHKIELQWRDEEINTIDNYHDSSVYYSFPPLSEISEVLNKNFLINKTFIPDYFLGDRCRTLQLRPQT